MELRYIVIIATLSAFATVAVLSAAAIIPFLIIFVAAAGAGVVGYAAWQAMLAVRDAADAARRKLGLGPSSDVVRMRKRDNHRSS